MTVETSYGYFSDRYGDFGLEWAKYTGMPVDEAKLKLKPSGIQRSRGYDRCVYYDGELTPFSVYTYPDGSYSIELSLKFVNYEHSDYILSEKLCLLTPNDDVMEALVSYMTCDICIQQEETSVGLRYYVVFPTMWDSVEYIIPTWAIQPLVYGDYAGLSYEDEKAVGEFEDRLVQLHKSIYLEFPYDIDREKYFCTRNDITDLGDTCVKATLNYKVTSRQS